MFWGRNLKTQTVKTEIRSTRANRVNIKIWMICLVRYFKKKKKKIMPDIDKHGKG